MKQKDRNKPCAETWINGLYEDKDYLDYDPNKMVKMPRNVFEVDDKSFKKCNICRNVMEFGDKDRIWCKNMHFQMRNDKNPPICGVPILHMVKCPILFEHDPCDLVPLKDCKSCEWKRYIYVDRVDCTYRE